MSTSHVHVPPAQAPRCFVWLRANPNAWGFWLRPEGAPCRVRVAVTRVASRPGAELGLPCAVRTLLPAATPPRLLGPVGGPALSTQNDSL